MSAIRYIKEAFLKSKQLEKEKFKMDMSKGTINKKRAREAFGITPQKQDILNQKDEECQFEFENLLKCEIEQVNLRNKVAKPEQ